MRPSFKDISIQVLHNLPDNSSMEEIMYRLNLAAQVMDGLDDEQSGNTISTTELLKKVDSCEQR